MRGALYEGRKHDLGCPEDDYCVIHRRLGREVPCGAEAGCPNWVRCAAPAPPAEALRRISFLVRLESMANVGCKWQVNDLSFDVWTELIILATERQRLDRLIREQQEASREAEREANTKADEARQMDKIPPPGASLFPGNAPR